MKKRLMSIGILLLAFVVSYFGFNLDPFQLINDQAPISNKDVLSDNSLSNDLLSDNPFIESSDNLNNDNTTHFDDSDNRAEETEVNSALVEEKDYIVYQFRNPYMLESHYKKHKEEFGDITMEEYLKGANDLVNQVSDSVQTKLDEDGDYIFYDTNTMEFGVLSSDGYLRTYFIPEDGIEYFNRK